MRKTRGPRILVFRKADGSVDGRIFMRMYGPLILAIAVIFLVVLFIFHSTVIYDSRKDIPQAPFLHDRYLLHNPKDVTSEVCGGALPCRWASTSDEATVMMFESKDDAKEAAGTLPDARRSNWIVVSFHSNQLTEQEKAEFMKWVNGIWHSDDAWFD